MTINMTQCRTPSSPSVSPTTVTARPIPRSSNVRQPVPDAQPHRQPQTSLAGPAASLRPEMIETIKRRRHQKCRGCEATMAMLTLRPVFATPIARHHVEPRSPDGTLTVHDRATNDRFLVYSPRFDHQFRAGHKAGKWYLRRLTDLGAAPRSPAFPAAAAAVKALQAGRWSIPAKTRYRSRASLRIIRLQASAGLPKEGRQTNSTSASGRLASV